MVFTPEMKKQFATYGDLVSFDLTFSLVKGQQSSQKWKLGCFLGQSRAKHMVPLGLVLTLHETQ